MFFKANTDNSVDINYGRFISASVIGATHADKGIMCQDAASCATLYYKGNKIYFMAVADGHGGDAYTRSAIGSFLAIQAASESVNRFIMYVIDVYEKYPDNWIEMVKEDFSGRFGKMLVSNWIRMVESHANETKDNPDEIIKLYGTTISIGLVINNYLFTGKIGDSSIFAYLNHNKMDFVKNLFENEDNNNNLGLGTSSLCSREAYLKWQIQILSLKDVKMLFMTTDGFTDSLKNPKEEIYNFYVYMIKRGVVNFEHVLNDELKQISDKGVGDDISLVILLPNLQGRMI